MSLARQISLGKEARRKLKESGNLHPLQVAKLNEIVDQAQQAREILASANTRLVISIAKKYQNMGLPLADLIQEGNVGLMYAVDGFDYKQGNRFSSYATWWIRREITRALTNKSRIIRLPIQMIKRLRQISKATEVLKQELGRPPSTQEISMYMDTPIDVIDDVMRNAPQIIALEDPVYGGETYGDFIEDVHTSPPEETVSQLLLSELLAAAMNTLNPKEQHVLICIYGFTHNGEQSLAEVGRSMGLSRERIRQIKEIALNHLRQSSYAILLKESVSV